MLAPLSLLALSPLFVWSAPRLGSVATGQKRVNRSGRLKVGLNDETLGGGPQVECILSLLHSGHGDSGGNGNALHGELHECYGQSSVLQPHLLLKPTT